MLIADFLILRIFGQLSPSRYFNFGIASFVFLLVYLGILLPDYRCFAYGYFKDITWKELHSRLIRAGIVPIKSIGISVLVHIIFWIGIFSNSRFLAITTLNVKTLPLFAISFGMVISTYLYVYFDGMVTRILIAHKITEYPRNLRQKRQALKAIIIPMATAFIGSLYSFSIGMLAVDYAGRNLDDMHGSAWLMVVVPVLIFFMFMGILGVRLKKNADLLFSSIINEVENLSSERKNLASRISVCSIDELGTIAGMINDLSKNLGTGIIAIKEGQEILNSVGLKLETGASGMAASILQISGTAEQVMEKAQSQNKNANTSSEVIHRIAVHIGELEKTIGVHVSSMSQASSSVEEMVGNVNSISIVTEKMASYFKNVEEAAIEGSRIQNESSVRIREIVEQSKSLQAANKIITTIAANTNLLAMNAAIEAAHAGDSGRGFSVVADEIRKLAVNSASESHKIGANLKQIVQTIDKIVKDAESTGSAFEAVSRRINETRRLVLEVDNAVREQKVGAKQVLESLQTMNDLTDKVRGDSIEMSKGNESMLRETEALKTSSSDISARIEEMFTGIKNLNSNAKEVSGMTIDTKTSIHKISKIVDEFEV
jgi:methyl-accepting chemotaxis protein